MTIRANIYGLLELPAPQQTLAMESAFAQSINPQTNAWLLAWAPLDWAHAHLMLKQVEESVAHGRLFFQRMQALQSLHALSRADALLNALEVAGYANVPVVRQFHEELQCQPHITR